MGDRMMLSKGWVEATKAKDPDGYRKRAEAKMLAAIHRLAFDVIPSNPAHPSYRMGGTLGGKHKHWFRAKFFQQYRLFFRFQESARVIIFAWVNDDGTVPLAEMAADLPTADELGEQFARFLAEHDERHKNLEHDQYADAASHQHPRPSSCGGPCRPLGR
jgi:hypothetical protein